MAGEFDTLALRRRVDEWRDEAARVPAGPMREFCLREACQYERRLRASACTPVIYERSIETGWSTERFCQSSRQIRRNGQHADKSGIFSPHNLLCPD
jgi:hypothetical protein